MTTSADASFADLGPDRIRQFRRPVPLIATLSGGIALFVLFSWFFGGASLQARWPALFVMKVNTATGILLLSVALLCKWREGRHWHIVGSAACVAAFLLTSGTIAEYLLGRNLGIDQPFIHDIAVISHPGRSSAPTAFCLTLLAVAMLLLDVDKIAMAAHLLTFLAASIPLATAAGYLYRTPGLSASAPIPIVSFHTSFCQLLLCLGTLLLRPQLGVTRTMVSDSLAGSLARRLFPLSLAVPIFVGLMVLLGANARLYSIQFGASLLVCCCATLFAGAVWWTTTILWENEKTRRLEEIARTRAEDALHVSQVRYKRLFETIDEGFCIIEVIFDPAGVAIDYRFIELNPAFSRQTGLHDVVGKRMKELVPDHDPHWFEIYGNIARTGEPKRFEQEAAALNRWFDVYAFRLDGTERFVAILFNDISIRKLADREREELLAAERFARNEAERHGRMKDEFLTTLSHELRTPLNAIVGWVQILKQTHHFDTELAEGLGVIDRNARAQTRIVEDILDMSRIVAGRLRLDLQPVDLMQLIKTATDTVQPAAMAKNICVRTMLDSHANLVSGDPNRLHQVFWNLLSNAVKFTPKGGRVQVEMLRIASHVQISVGDTGEGIEPEFLPFVFDRFRQADATTTRRHGGLGLGLAIVKEIVGLHGGTVTAQSDGIGKGTTFIVSLPVSAVQHDASEAEDPEQSTANSSVASSDMHHGRHALKGIHVLLVDDEPDGRSILRRVLEGQGATVRAAESAKEAMSLLAEEVPTVLISDIGMPEHDGYDLIRRVRSLPSDAGGSVSAIAVTAYARSADRVQALQAGFQMHLAKPVEPTELILSVANLAATRTHRA